LIAAGLSNREIADRLFVSENTVKTHSSRLFDKLGARRRTQAVQLGKQAHLILMGRPKVSFSADHGKITRRYDDNFRRPPHNPSRATHKFESEDLK
jgi:predicted ArsR family transcriptional regulator